MVEWLKELAFWQVIFLFIGGVYGVYVVTRVASSAYFRSKADYMKGNKHD